MTPTDLQNEINRFASDPNIGFTPLICDGCIGPATLQGAIYALTTISLTDFGDFGATQQAGQLLNQINTPADLSAQLDIVGQLLQHSANELGTVSSSLGYLNPDGSAVTYEYVPCVAGSTTCGSSAPVATQSQAKPAATTSKAQNIASVGSVKTAAANVGLPFLGNLYQSWTGLPSWAKVAGYSLVGIGALYAGHRVLRKRKGRHG